MIKYERLSTIDTVTFLQKQQIVDFLFEHLDQYGDKKEDIMKALEYAVSSYHHQGGFVLLAKDSDNDNQLVATVIVNKTGMEGYIPENILVYIATHRDYRGKGLGKGLMQRAIDMANGSIALHVEPDNPAKYLYEKMGFTNKYLEMRYHK